MRINLAHQTWVHGRPRGCRNDRWMSYPGQTSVEIREMPIEAAKAAFVVNYPQGTTEFGCQDYDAGPVRLLSFPDSDDPLGVWWPIAYDLKQWLVLMQDPVVGAWRTAPWLARLGAGLRFEPRPHDKVFPHPSELKQVTDLRDFITSSVQDAASNLLICGSTVYRKKTEPLYAVRPRGYDPARLHERRVTVEPLHEHGDAYVTIELVDPANPSVEAARERGLVMDYRSLHSAYFRPGETRFAAHLAPTIEVLRPECIRSTPSLQMSRALARRLIDEYVVPSGAQPGTQAAAVIDRVRKALEFRLGIVACIDDQRGLASGASIPSACYTRKDRVLHDLWDRIVLQTRWLRADVAQGRISLPLSTDEDRELSTLSVPA